MKPLENLFKRIDEFISELTGDRYEKRREKLKKIQRGWHRQFVWFPTRTLDDTIACLRWVEVKYYIKKGKSYVIKEDLNTALLDSHDRVKKMCRESWSSQEKKVYCRESTGTLFVDSRELLESEAVQKELERFSENIHLSDE